MSKLKEYVSKYSALSTKSVESILDIGSLELEERTLDLYREFQIQVFTRMNKIKPNMFDFAIAYQKYKLNLQKELSEMMSSANMRHAMESDEYALITFLGIDKKFGTHNTIKDARIFSTILSKLIKEIQFPSLFISQIVEAIGFHQNKKINYSQMDYVLY